MLTKIREALEDYGEAEGAEADAKAALEELALAEKALREALALKVWAVAGLSAFHGRLCSRAQDWHEEEVSALECSDPKCRAWAAAVKESP